MEHWASRTNTSPTPHLVKLVAAVQQHDRALWEIPLQSPEHAESVAMATFLDPLPASAAKVAALQSAWGRELPVDVVSFYRLFGHLQHSPEDRESSIWIPGPVQVLRDRRRSKKRRGRPTLGVVDLIGWLSKELRGGLCDGKQLTSEERRALDHRFYGFGWSTRLWGEQPDEVFFVDDRSQSGRIRVSEGMEAVLDALRALMRGNVELVPLEDELVAAVRRAMECNTGLGATSGSEWWNPSPSRRCDS